MEVKAGFKQTEVGVIPEEWQALPLAQVGGFRKGQGIRKNEAASGNIPCVRYGEIYTHHNDIIRAYNSYISLTVAETSRRLRKGDILFAGSGETKAEIGKAVAFVEDIEAYAGGDIVILSPQAACSEYLGYVLNSPVVTRQKASKGQGDAVVHISADALGTVYAPLPPLIEQRAIAAALSDVDALLDWLDMLIAKKRDLKQAAMQQLLSGTVRLPGFNGEWEVKRLGDVVEIEKGQLITSKTLKPGDIPVIAGGKKPAYFHESANRFGRTITISASGASAGYVALYNEPIFASDCSTISEAQSYCLNFIFYQLLYKQQTIYKFQTGGAQPHIHAKDLNPILFYFPAVPEQTAIATVLSDMDAELSALQTRRDKVARLKQGMMQELLSGRTRLVPQEARLA